MCPPLFGMEGRNGMVKTVEKEGRDGGHAEKIGRYPSLVTTKILTHDLPDGSYALWNFDWYPKSILCPLPARCGCSGSKSSICTKPPWWP